jgi:hypothetical protein
MQQKKEKHMYKDNLVVAVKVDGKVLREHGDTVAIPFGSEYAVFLKNKSSVRAMVKVEIDGTDVTGNTWLIINPNSNMDLERFIKNGNWNSGNKFKFIKRTGKIEEHRGVKAEDGLVRIEYKFEKMPDPEVHTHHYYHHHYPYDYYYWPWYPWNTTYTVNSNSLLDSGNTNVLRSRGMKGGGLSGQAFRKFADSLGDSDNVTFTNTTGALNSPPAQVNCFSMSSGSGSAGTEFREASLDPGITVEGGRSDQKFVDVGWFPTEDTSHVIVLKLVGAVGGKVVRQAITVKTKQKCHTCGTTNKSGVKFCKECGTSCLID